MFHIGHLNVLRRAKQACDHLIVGVTTDELSTQAKNKTPIIPFEERLEIVRSIEFVDEVVAQTSYDKMQAWEKHRFDRMFVGDDWKGTEKWNRIEADFARLNVEVCYFPYTAHTSSTILRQALGEMPGVNLRVAAG